VVSGNVWPELTTVYGTESTSGSPAIAKRLQVPVKTVMRPMVSNIVLL
jgi:hypothetical protein